MTRRLAIGQELSFLGAYVHAVLRHSYWLAISGLAVFGYGGDALDLWSYTDDLRITIPRWIWFALFAVGLLAAQFRAWYDVIAQLAEVRGRLGELDTRAARFSFYDEAIGRLESIKEQFAAVEMLPSHPHGDHYRWQESLGVKRLVSDLGHLEDTTRAAMYDAEERGWFPFGTGERFDSDEGFVTGPNDGNVWHLRENCLDACDRRLTRLRELRSEV